MCSRNSLLSCPLDSNVCSFGETTQPSWENTFPPALHNTPQQCGVISACYLEISRSVSQMPGLWGFCFCEAIHRGCLMWSFVQLLPQHFPLRSKSLKSSHFNSSGGHDTQGVGSLFVISTEGFSLSSGSSSYGEPQGLVCCPWHGGCPASVLSLIWRGVVSQTLRSQQTTPVCLPG